MKTMTFILAFTAIAIFIGCTGSPAAVDSWGNIQPIIRDFRITESGAIITDYGNKDFLPNLQPDGSVIVSRKGGINIRIMPMTDSRSKGAMRPDSEINELIKENEAVLQANPQDFDACIMLAGLYIDRNRQGDADEAIKYSNMALAINSEDPQALLARGISYREIGENEKALEDLQSVMRVSAQSVKGVYYVMGMIYYGEATDLKNANKLSESAAKLDAAIDAFEKVEALDPGFIDIQTILASLRRNWLSQ